MFSGKQENPIQQEIQKEKKRMFSLLNFDENLQEKVEEMFNINFDGLPIGKEPMIFSTAIFKIQSAELAMREFEQLDDVDLTDEDDEVHYVWTRPYPKGHWNPMSSLPGARQIIGNIHVNYDNTITLETRTKSWMTALIYYMIDILGDDIRLIDLEFRNPMDMLRDEK